VAKVTLLTGEVLDADVVKVVRASAACPTKDMAVWYPDQGQAGRCSTAVERVSRGVYKEVV
jgi:hypothetical protein